MREKVAIITLNHGANYGNKLQNYAVQTLYQNLGYDVETIRFYPEALKVTSTEKISLSVALKKINKRWSNFRYSEKIKERNQVFKKFNENYLIMSESFYTPSNYHQIDEEKYDFFSVGSDQVWNSYFFDFTPMYLLDFVSDDSKKIAYSASFGVSDIALEYQNQFKECLSRFKLISVREEAGRKIINDVCGRQAQVVLDPTLMLNKEDWNDFLIGVNRKSPESYVLTYFLGELSKEHKIMIYSYAAKHNAQVVELNNINADYYDCDPREFVSMFRDALMVFTDSFHACCFSIIYQKAFWVLQRNSTGKDMGSRIDTLLAKFQLKDRQYYNGIELDTDVDYTSSEKILESEKNESMKFLVTALGGESL